MGKENLMKRIIIIALTLIMVQMAFLSLPKLTISIFKTIPYLAHAQRCAANANCMGSVNHCCGASMTCVSPLRTKECPFDDQIAMPGGTCCRAGVLPQDCCAGMCCGFLTMCCRDMCTYCGLGGVACMECNDAGFPPRCCKADATCCGFLCCSMGQQCCEGMTKCCGSSEVCSGDMCCLMSRACGIGATSQCCTATQMCCGTGATAMCCLASACCNNTQCCAAGQECCVGNSMCVPFIDNNPCGTTCCMDMISCCDNMCCGMDQVCCPDDGSCTDPGFLSCNGMCCSPPSNVACCMGACCAMACCLDGSCTDPCPIVIGTPTPTVSMPPSPSPSPSVPTCFLAGTLITTVDGIVPIEKLKVGEKVLTFSTSNKKTKYVKVLKLSKSKCDHYYLIKTKSQEVNVTAEHPFYVGDSSFKKVKELTTKDELYVMKNNELYQTTIISILLVNKSTTVYNLQVEPPNTFVANGFIVHNKTTTSPSPSPSPSYTMPPTPTLSPLPLYTVPPLFTPTPPTYTSPYPIP